MRLELHRCTFSHRLYAGAAAESIWAYYKGSYLEGEVQ